MQQTTMPENKVSKAIQLLRKLVKQKPIRVSNETKFDYDKKAINIAFDKICYLWNLDLKKRAWIATIIKYSIPIDETMIEKELPENSCDCFTGRQLAGMNEIRDFIKRFASLKARAEMMLQQLQDANYQNKQNYDKLTEYKQKIGELISITEPRLKHADFAYALEMRSGTIYMSRESVFALKCFVRYALLLDDPDIRRAVDKNTENALAKSSKEVGNLVDKETADKLKAFKEKLLIEFKDASEMEQQKQEQLVD